jgi:hypothetical protein
MDKKDNSFGALALGLPVVDAVPASFVAADNKLKAIMSLKYLDWVDWLRSRSLTYGVAKFFHSLIHGEPHRIKCEVDEAALAAGECQVRVLLDLGPQERMLLAALRARDRHDVRLHLTALGLI